MSYEKKTVSVSSMLEHANILLSLKESDVITKDFKEGVCTMITKMLMMANRYNGFMFIDNTDTDLGTFGNVSRKYF
jgi:hypothetical protein